MTATHSAAETSTRPVLEAVGVRKVFGHLEVLKGIDLAIEEGEFLVLVGPSGCGKSTLLNAIAGLETITSGEIRIDGRSMTGVPPKDRNIAMVFQSYALYPTMSVADNITFGLKMRNVAREVRQAALERVARMLRIDHLLDRRPSQLSGGQRQRVAMGRALVREPRLFLFDEPLSNLDAKLRTEMRTEIKKLHHRLGTTIVYVTHDQTEAMSLASRIAVMNQGRIVQLGTPEELYNRPDNLFVADFIGSPAMNFVDGTLRRSDGSWSFVTEHEGRPLALPLAGYRFRAPPTDGQVTRLGIRPEYVTGEQAGAQGQGITLELMPTLTETNGFDQHVMFEFAGTEIGGRFPPHQHVLMGRPARVYIDLSNVSLFDPATEERL